MDIFLQVGTGTSGPRIEALNLNDPSLFFAGFPDSGPFERLSDWQVAWGVLDTGSPGKSGSGDLAIVTLDTTGITSGDYALGLSVVDGLDTYETALWKSSGPPPYKPTLIPGLLRISSAVVPEPGALVQLLGLAVCAPAGWWYFRRRRSAA